MNQPRSTKPTWPIAYRILLWLIGSLLAILLFVSINGLNAQH